MANPPNRTHRYQGWELTPRGKVKGVWPIDPSLLPDVYTEVELDQRGTIVALREQRDGHPDPLVRTFFYEKGRVEHQEYTDPLSGMSGRNYYTYSKSGLLCERKETDTQDRMRYRIEVDCDAQGRFAEERVFEGQKRAGTRHVYHYNSAGLLEKDETFVGKEMKDLKGFHALVYDDKGRIVRRAWNSPDGKEVETFTYIYDNFDRRVEMAIEKDGVRTMRAVTEFDAEGRTKAVHYIDAEGTHVKGGAFGDGKPLTAAQISDAMKDVQDKLKDVARNDPKKLEALSQVAYSQFEAGQYDEARKLYESLTALEPDNPYYLSALGATALQQNQPQTALNYYERALRRDRKHIESRVGRADALLRLKRVDEALQLLADVVKAGASKDDPALRRARAMLVALTQPKAGARPS